MKRVFNLLVVDESGSMSIIERQALVGINETLTRFRKCRRRIRTWSSGLRSSPSTAPTRSCFMIMCLLIILRL